MEALWHDVRFALRVLRQSFSVTILAIGLLALGIAGNTILFSLLDGMLYRPLPYEDPERLLVVCERPQGYPGSQITPSSALNFLDWQEQQTSFEGMSAMKLVALSLDNGTRQREHLSAMAMTPGMFEQLGTRPDRGRFFLPEEGVLGNHRVVVLSYGFWAERYGEEDPLGQSLRINGESYEIIGVTERDFAFLDPNLKVYIPLALDRVQLDRSQRDVIVGARLRPEVTEEEALAEMVLIMDRLKEEYPEANRGYTVIVINSREWFPDPGNRRLLQLLQGGMFFVLLIACANVANLLLARGQQRGRELAIRTSLGARRVEILRQLFAESMVMALIAGTLGFGVAAVGIRVMAKSLANLLPPAFAPVIDSRTFLFNLLFTLVGGFLFGLAPVLQTRRLDFVEALKEGSQSTTQGGRKRLASKVLVVAELTLALVFLGGASVLLRSFEIAREDDPGFATENLVVAQFSLPRSHYDSTERLLSGVTALESRLRSLPGASAVAVTNVLPRSVQTPRAIFSIDAEPPAPDEPFPGAFWLAAGPGYFGTLGITVEGRPFALGDGADAPAVAIVNQAAVKLYWGGENPLGERITVMGRSREIVGVAGNAQHLLQITSEMPPVIYLPWAQQPNRVLAVALRSSVGGGLTEPLRQELLRFDPDMAIAEIGLMDELLEKYFVGAGVITILLRVFGALALVLAAIGTYGILAYSVALRTHEIGVRMAVGADRSQVLKMIIVQGTWMGGIGIVLGIPGVLLVRQVVSTLFEDVVPIDAGVIVVPCVVLLAVTLLASFWPARRAASIQPVTALRQE